MSKFFWWSASGNRVPPVCTISANWPFPAPAWHCEQTPSSTGSTRAAKKPRSGWPGAEPMLGIAGMDGIDGAAGAPGLAAAGEPGGPDRRPLDDVMNSTQFRYAAVPLKIRSPPPCLTPPSRSASGFRRNFDWSGLPGTSSFRTVREVRPLLVVGERDPRRVDDQLELALALARVALRAHVLEHRLDPVAKQGQLGARLGGDDRGGGREERRAREAQDRGRCPGEGPAAGGRREGTGSGAVRGHVMHLGVEGRGAPNSDPGAPDLNPGP